MKSLLRLFFILTSLIGLPGSYGFSEIELLYPEVGSEALLHQNYPHKKWIWHFDLRFGITQTFSKDLDVDQKYGFIGGLGLLKNFGPLLTVYTPMVLFNQQLFYLKNLDHGSTLVRSDTLSIIPGMLQFNIPMGHFKPYVGAGGLLLYSLQSAIEYDPPGPDPLGSYHMAQQIQTMNAGFYLETGFKVVAGDKLGTFSLFFAYFNNFLETLREFTVGKSVSFDQYFWMFSYQHDIIPLPHPPRVVVEYEPPPPSLNIPPPPKPIPIPVITLSTDPFVCEGPEFAPLVITLQDLDKTNASWIKVDIFNQEKKHVIGFESGNSNEYSWDGMDSQGNETRLSTPQTYTIDVVVTYHDTKKTVHSIKDQAFTIKPYIYPLPDPGPTLTMRSSNFSPDGDTIHDQAIFVIDNLDKRAMDQVELTIFDVYNQPIKHSTRQSLDEIFVWDGIPDDGSSIRSHSKFVISGKVTYRGHEEIHLLGPVEFQSGAALIPFETPGTTGFRIQSEAITFTEDNLLTPLSKELLENIYDKINAYQFTAIQITVYFTNEAIYKAYSRSELIEQFFYQKELKGVQVITGVFPKHRKKEFASIQNTLVELTIYKVKDKKDTPTPSNLTPSNSTP